MVYLPTFGSFLMGNVVRCTMSMNPMGLWDSKMVVSPSALVDQIFTPLLGEILTGTQLHIEPPSNNLTGSAIRD